VPAARPPASAAKSARGAQTAAIPEVPKKDAAGNSAALAAAPGSAEALSPLEQREQRAQTYARQAQRQQAAGDFAGLARTCEKWADDDWRNPRAYYCAGLGLQGIGQHKKAIAMFNRAGELLQKGDPLKTLIADAVLKSFRAESER
jgi:tetratricopeptide (TPR) repeat protein